MKRLAVLISYSGDGGVEASFNNLFAAWSQLDIAVDLLAIKRRGRFWGRLPANVNVIPLARQHALTCVPEVARYLRRWRPDAVLAAKDRAGRAALQAASWAGTGTPVYICLGTNLSASLEKRSAFARWLRVAPMRRIYARAAGVIAVSEGVRRDTLALTGLPAERVHAVPNPVITPDMALQAAMPAPHPWFEDAEMPVIMGMGRLTPQKDFPTLLRAFARLRREQPARLILLGEGAERENLQRLVRESGLEDHVALPGFSDTPYAWLSRAQLFVLSSAWEGSGNVLTEAMALGVPCIATDCPSGPAEILGDGRYGPLVSVGDVEGLARAMQATLRAPLPAASLRAAVEDYRADLSARRYLEVLGLSA